jgi:DNA-binding transcriptional MerR regulator/quercetin dioxygenase-like cupin family protein
MVGVSAATLRAWEREGLVRPLRTGSGYRRFSLEDVTRLRHIQRLRNVQGFNVPAIRRELGESAEARRNGIPATRLASDLVGRLKRLRLRHGLSLRRASSRTGLSPSFISSIERGLANPSVAALQKLTAAYSTSIAELMGTSESATRKLIRPGDRPTYVSSPGVRLEQLNVGVAQMELHLFSVSPGAGSDESYQHEGEEFIYLLEGTLEVWLDAVERYVLEAGDVLYFRSTQSHRWTNVGDGNAVFLGVNTPPTF